MASIKRQYLDLNLGNIGELLPQEKFRFDSQKTYDIIIEKIQTEILKQMSAKTDPIVVKQTSELQKKIMDVTNNKKLKIGDEFDNALYDVCKKIPFDDNYNTKTGLMGKIPHQIFNLIPNYKSESNNNEHAQYVVGRVASIHNIGGYDIKGFKILLLGGKSFIWTPIVNDLFITCSLAFAKILNRPENLINQTTLFFPIMLVMDKACLEDKSEVPLAFSQSNISANTYNSMYKDLKAQNPNVNATCVFPNTPSLPFPSVTFRELVILGDIIGMNIYKLKTPPSLNLVTDNHFLYYFSFKNDVQLGAKIIEFNTKNKGTGFELIKVKINWARKDSPFKENQTGGKYYEKYMKYKNKYMLLKKIGSVKCKT
jgi:hypothetical protein